ncbi:hypothetical protein [Devosia sp.]|uniref:hypothetical protein n=1 Tax=Devosia sp. TaxID=1871048 RepID=UPI002F0E96B5
MKFQPIGPLELPRDDKNLLNFDEYGRKTMWDDFEAEVGAPRLRDACGCYVFAIRASKGMRPWYIGKAERQAFKNECFTAHKLEHYNRVLAASERGTPLLFFYARKTPTRDVWSKPSRTGYRDVDLLEDLLIGAALRKNRELLNVQKTDLLMNMEVPGFLNSRRGKLSTAANDLKRLFAY